MQVNMFDAKSQLSKLVKAALAGEEVIIANKGVPSVRLVPVSTDVANRKLGGWSHLNMTEEQIDEAFSPTGNAEVAKLFGLPGLTSGATKHGRRRPSAKKKTATKKNKL